MSKRSSLFSFLPPLSPTKKTSQTLAQLVRFTGSTSMLSEDTTKEPSPSSATDEGKFI